MQTEKAGLKTTCTVKVSGIQATKQSEPEIALKLQKLWKLMGVKKKEKAGDKSENTMSLFQRVYANHPFKQNKSS